jgi:hypothetical protein
LQYWEITLTEWFSACLAPLQQQISAAKTRFHDGKGSALNLLPKHAAEKETLKVNFAIAELISALWKGASLSGWVSAPGHLSNGTVTLRDSRQPCQCTLRIPWDVSMFQQAPDAVFGSPLIPVNDEIRLSHFAKQAVG